MSNLMRFNYNDALITLEFSLVSLSYWYSISLPIINDCTPMLLIMLNNNLKLIRKMIISMSTCRFFVFIIIIQEDDDEVYVLKIQQKQMGCFCLRQVLLKRVHYSSMDKYIHCIQYKLSCPWSLPQHSYQLMHNIRPGISLDHCSLSLALPSKVQDPNCGPPRQQSDRTAPTMIRAI